MDERHHCILSFQNLGQLGVELCWLCLPLKLGHTFLVFINWAILDCILDGVNIMLWRSCAVISLKSGDISFISGQLTWLHSNLKFSLPSRGRSLKRSSAFSSLCELLVIWSVHALFGCHPETLGRVYVKVGPPFSQIYSFWHFPSPSRWWDCSRPVFFFFFWVRKSAYFYILMPYDFSSPWCQKNKKLPSHGCPSVAWHCSSYCLLCIPGSLPVVCYRLYGVQSPSFSVRCRVYRNLVFYI